jgi:predicted aldo/keto reductase-like oxidoreductase
MGSEKPSRRKFLLHTLGGVTLASGATIGAVEWYERRHKPRILSGPELPKLPVIEDRPGLVDPNAGVTAKRRLGRTGLQVSIVGIGAGGLEGTEPIVRAVDKGMNFIDTSICYGNSEEVIGRALKSSPGLREKLIIATKWDPGHDTSKEKILESLDKSLVRLGVDHVDIMQLHWLGGGHTRPDDGFNRLDNPALYAAMQEAKKSGKVRFFGATSHHEDRANILMHAIDKGAFDMLLVKMNVLDYEAANMPALLKKAKEKDVGVVVMKSQPGGGRIPPGFEKSKWSIYQANLRWVLEHEEVACVVHSGIGVDAKTQDQAVGATLEKLGAAERTLLEQYATALSPDYCRGCGSRCTAACPEQVAIPHVLQFAMYDEQYRWHARAREHYRALPLPERWSERCASCNECTAACPHGLDPAGIVRGAVRLA